MKYGFIEILIAILDIFNNPAGIAGAVVAFLTGVCMCVYGNLKSRIICICSLFAIAIFSIIICISENSPDYLILPMFVLPLLIITLIIFMLYEFVKMLINAKHKKQ